MKLNMLTCCCLISLTLLSCKPREQTQQPDDTPIVTGDPVETLPPNTSYQPAFPGQTRIGSVKTQTQLQIDIIAADIGHPWGIINLPDGRLLVTDKSGFMQIFSAQGQLMSKIEGFPAVAFNGQGGMLDVALDPDFAINKMMYWSFSEPFQNGNLTAVAKGKLSADETMIENPTVIFRAEPAYNGALHFGSRLVFDKDGHLFVSTGERSDLATRPQAQLLNSGLGKIFRITKDGAAVTGNPFINTPDAIPQIYSYGHRNPQGLAIHPETGELWEAEFGPLGGDEINKITAGVNYGWAVITYGLEYSGQKIGEGITQKEGMQQPVYYWDPVVSPSGITFYSGSQIPEWKNNLFVACLSSQHICRLVIQNGKVVGEERLLKDQAERFRDVLSGMDGSLYAVTDSGKIYRISKKV